MPRKVSFRVVTSSFHLAFNLIYMVVSSWVPSLSVLCASYCCASFVSKLGCGEDVLRMEAKVDNHTIYPWAKKDIFQHVSVYNNWDQVRELRVKYVFT
ncbi:hypothetical protein VNO78_20046 [Psophocarpus tetragonolobus]|uniref:Uncharacterized protein n=1 Tax=Psophocarpus tetragonolobus TaxID=3891 RepID=A0AAN9XGR7_PSOTE